MKRKLRPYAETIQRVTEAVLQAHVQPQKVGWDFLQQMFYEAEKRKERLQKLFDLGAPVDMIQNERRMLFTTLLKAQEAYKYASTLEVHEPVRLRAFLHHVKQLRVPASRPEMENADPAFKAVAPWFRTGMAYMAMDHAVTDEIRRERMLSELSDNLLSDIECEISRRLYEIFWATPSLRTLLDPEELRAASDEEE